jgi:hypothetical protein
MPEQPRNGPRLPDHGELDGHVADEPGKLGRLARGVAETLWSGQRVAPVFD